jgi:hypothetical protein
LGIGEAIKLILASPRFLFRTEQPHSNTVAVDSLAIPLDDYSIASRMSYFLWGGPPDEELLRIAEQGKLREQLDQQFERMISQEWRLRRGISNFVGQWLQTRDVHTVQADAARILEVGFEAGQSYFDWNMREALTQETLRFYEHLLSTDRPIEEILNARYTFLNEYSAKLYGIDGVSGNNVRKVDLPESSHRRGLLTHGSFLLVTSNPTRTSPVKRGLFVLENLLGTPAPPAPPNVPALENSKSGELKNASLRQILEFHRRDPGCASCHERMDPLGLAMEHYNALGQYRETEKVDTWENGKLEKTQQPIDTAGKLMSGETFATVEELAEILAEKRRDDFYRCLTEKLLTFALGRGMTYRDTTAIDKIVAETKQNGGKMKTLYKSILSSVPFTHCRPVQGGQSLVSQPNP